MSEDIQVLIDDVVAKALAGDMDPINNIEDRVTRSKAKAALLTSAPSQAFCRGPYLGPIV